MEREIKNKELRNNNMGVGADVSKVSAENQQPAAQQPVMKQPAMQQPQMMPNNMQQMPMMQMPQQMPMMQMPQQMPMMQMPQQMPMMQMPQQMPQQMPGMGEFPEMDYISPPICPYLMNMQCPVMNNQGFGGINPMNSMMPMYQQPPIYMSYPYMNPNR